MTYAIHRYPVALIDVVDLGGERVTIRPILPQDAPLEQTFVRGLSPGARQRRFFSGMRELAPSLLEAFTSVDYRSHFALIAEVFAGDTEVIVGDARYAVDDDPSTAEFALAVADDWQGRGLGRLLLARLECHAKATGIARLVGDTFRDNRAMLGLAARAGFRISPERRGPGVVRVEKVLAPAPGFVPCYAQKPVRAVALAA